MMVDGNVIDVHDLPEQLRDHSGSADEDETLPSLEEIQRQYVLRVLESVHGNKSRAAEILGIGRSTLYQLIPKLDESRATTVKGKPIISPESITPA